MFDMILNLIGKIFEWTFILACVVIAIVIVKESISDIVYFILDKVKKKMKSI